MHERFPFFVAGDWHSESPGGAGGVINPAREAVNGRVAHATMGDVDRALAAADAASAVWRGTPSHERAVMLDGLLPMKRDCRQEEGEAPSD